MKILLSLGVLLFSASFYGQSILPAEIQIKTAVLAAPEDQREETTVLGYNEDGELVVLKKGTSNLICLADDPNSEGVKVACYAKELEPFMARGREFLAAGKTEAEKRELRAQEVAEGKLKMPEKPSMLYVLSGTDENYDTNTGALENAYFRYVIYVPYATTESTGLPAKPFSPGMPWLMDPGTHKAHIMISPAKEEQAHH